MMDYLKDAKKWLLGEFHVPRYALILLAIIVLWI
jgi:hypothetical protein|tara:strand:- start:528 stop:629 length:102 start_codon:yes stop_codon:yes gene_type:complete